MDKTLFYSNKCRCCCNEISEESAAEIDETIASQIAYITAIEVRKNKKFDKSK